MSQQQFDGRASNLTFEKTFDSYSRRDHLRIWKSESTVNDEPLWVASAVRETGATLSLRRMRFMHHVLEDLDEEQRAIQRDLLAVGCVDSIGKVERPRMDKAMVNATGEVLRTNGDVIVLSLKTCSVPSSSSNDTTRFRPGSNFFRYLRKEILTVRSDLERANVIYLAVHLVVGTTQVLRHISAVRADIRSAIHVAATRIPAGGSESLPTSSPNSVADALPLRGATVRLLL